MLIAIFPQVLNAMSKINEIGLENELE